MPIPALFREGYEDSGEFDEAVMTADSIDHIITVIGERGTDAWWSDPEDDPAWIAPSLPPGKYIRGKDTMDVWFDSGSSWTSLEPRVDSAPADVYVEGTDQHRGWFQSSLLTHVASQDTSSTSPVAPFKTLITHGFTLDSSGRKMSKSLGNVVTPEEILSGALLPNSNTTTKSKSTRTKPTTPPPQQYKSARDQMGPDVLRLSALPARA